MKRILFLFTASLLLLACSNDDNDPQAEDNNPQALKTFKFLENNEPNTLDSGKEFFLDQDGKITKFDVLTDNLPVALTSHFNNGNPNKEYTETNEIEYNDNGKPVSSISTSSRENVVARRLTYEYY